jgi:hypothetical protein
MTSFEGYIATENIVMLKYTNLILCSCFLQILSYEFNFLTKRGGKQQHIFPHAKLFKECWGK